MTAIALALTTAVGFGAGDFLAGMAARRHTALPVAIAVQAVSLLLLLAATPLVGLPTDGRELAWGGLAGLALGIGTVAYFRGLATGRMGVVATVAAVLTAVAPLLFGLAAGERPNAVAWGGIAAVLAALVLVTGTEEEAGRDAPATAGLVDGAVGGVGFGLFVVGVSEGAAVGSALWPVATAAGLALAVLTAIALTLGVPVRLGRADAPTVLGAGALGALASLALVAATRTGMLGVVAVVAALSPAPTMLLARTFLGERLGARQLAGMGLALAGVAALTLASG